MTTVDEIVPLLRAISLFEGLPREDLERLAGIGEEWVLPAGETLIRGGRRFFRRRLASGRDPPAPNGRHDGEARRSW